MIKIKPGYKTSEFWFTLVSFLFSGLYLLGIIGDNSQKEDLIRDVSHGVESIILIGGQLAILFKYLNSRKQIKETYYQNNLVENNKPEQKPEQEPEIKKTEIKKGTKNGRKPKSSNNKTSSTKRTRRNNK